MAAGQAPASEQRSAFRLVLDGKTGEHLETAGLQRFCQLTGGLHSRQSAQRRCDGLPRGIRQGLPGVRQNRNGCLQRTIDRFFVRLSCGPDITVLAGEDRRMRGPQISARADKSIVRIAVMPEELIDRPCRNRWFLQSTDL